MAFALLCGLSLWLHPARGDEHAAGRISFARDIRPILSDACFQCHGPDPRARQAGLQLHKRTDVFRKRTGGAIVLAGHPERSALYRRIIADDIDLRMPPPDAARQLTREETERIRRWIEDGGEWQEHWAYTVPQWPPVPSVENDGAFVRNPIDAFLLEKMREHRFEPASEADRRTLIRRLSLDLTGLPPAADDVEAFVADDSPEAYERLVDRLLASPRFGERMATLWLDLVRYADTNGYLGDRHEDRDLYRDWVINAFNRNLPFDQFTIDQLAGDLLPHASDESRIASGYNRLLMTTREVGAQPGDYLARYSADRVRNFSSVWLATTLGCAACHDHKYDPFATRDFYRLAAIFADIQEIAVGVQPQSRFPTAEQAAGLAVLDKQIELIRLQLSRSTHDLEDAQRAWESSVHTSGVKWNVICPTAMTSFGGASLHLLEDGSIKVHDSPARDTLKLSFRLSLKDVTALRLEAIPDDDLPAKGPGWGEAGAFVVTELTATANRRPLTFSGWTATHSEPGFEPARAVDDDPETGWGVFDQSGASHQAVFALSSVSRHEHPVDLQVTLHHDFGDSCVLGRFQLAVTTASPGLALKGAAVPQAVSDILYRSPAQRTTPQRETVATFFRSIAPALEAVRCRLLSLQKQRKQLESQVRKTLITTAGVPREIRVLPRGDWLDSTGDVVAPGIPTVLSTHQPPGANHPSRLDLAKWVTSPGNPLPARVIVNRLWKLAFGQGLVRSMEDFGAQGTPPTHAELLDWLAVEFMNPEAGAGTPHAGDRVASPGAASEGRSLSPSWDLKRLLRLIVTSGAYRQSSAVTAELRQRDPDNRWLSRQSRYRLEAEMVRDHALSVSGLLSASIGGRSVRPYQPSGYWALLNREWQTDAGEDLYRRGLYTYWCRTFLHPSLKAFDASTREESCAERPQSNTPLQALVLLNDPTHVEAARVFAERILREGGTDQRSRLEFAFRQALSRSPRDAEAAVLNTLYARHHAQFVADPEAAAEVLNVGVKVATTDLSAADLAAWTSLARVILNLHEAITRN